VTSNGKAHIATIAETLARVRSTANATTTFILVEAAYSINIPAHVYAHPSFQALERIGNDFILLQNAILSYQKEQLEDVNNNIIGVCRAWGMGAQEAFDYAGSLLDGLYKDWFHRQAELPSWGEQIDGQVQLFLRGIVDCVLGNLHWSYRTERYLGKKKDFVRQAGKIEVFGDRFYADARRMTAEKRARMNGGLEKPLFLE